MDQAIHRLNVAHYTLDVKVTQLVDRVSQLDGTIGEVQDTMQQISLLTKENRKEIGRLEGMSSYTSLFLCLVEMFYNGILRNNDKIMKKER
jgi:small nuclear ribonucleoprotein (snRNP)-like protein